MKKLILLPLLLFPLCALAQFRVNVMTTNTSAGVTNKVLEIALPWLAGGPTNGILILNGFGTNTTLRYPSLLAATGTQGMVPWLDAGSGGFGFYVGGGNDAEEFFYFDDSTWVCGSNGVASIRAQSFIGPLVGNLANATNLPPVTGIAGWPANAYGHFVNNGSGTLSWESPLWWTNAAAATSISNAFNLKSTSVDVGSYIQRSGQFILNSSGLRLGNSTSPDHELQVLGDAAIRDAAYFTNKIFFGGTNGIIGIGSNLTVQAGILSGTATGSGSGGTVPTNTFHGSIVTSNNAATQAFDTGYSTITNWTRTGPSYGVAGDIGAGTLTVSNAGTYVVGVALSYATTTQPADVYAEVFKNADATGLRAHRDMTANNAHGSATILGLLTLASNDVLSVKVLCAASETLSFGEAQLFVTTFGGETNVSGGTVNTHVWQTNELYSPGGVNTINPAQIDATNPPIAVAGVWIYNDPDTGGSDISPNISQLVFKSQIGAIGQSDAGTPAIVLQSNPTNAVFIKSGRTFVVEGDTDFQGDNAFAAATVGTLTVTNAYFPVSVITNLVAGTATLNGQTNVVATAAIAAGSKVFLTYRSLDQSLANIAEDFATRTNGVSFTVLSSKAGDTNVVSWLIYP